MVLLCVRMLGAGRGAFFLAVAFAVSTALEIAGLHGAGIFGPVYQYNIWPKAFGLPFLIPAFWMGVIFFSYSFVNSFLTWTGRAKPARGRGGFVPLVLLVLADGLSVAIVDLALDPVAVGVGLWSWSEPGPFFGVPLANILGWFVIGALVSAIFRGFEYLKPGSPPRAPDTTVLLSVLGYGTIGLGLILQAWAYDFPAIAVIPPLTAGPALVLNAVLYLTRRRGRQ